MPGNFPDEGSCMLLKCEKDSFELASVCVTYDNVILVDSFVSDEHTRDRSMQ